jgi:hypothetical protein
VSLLIWNDYEKIAGEKGAFMGRSYAGILGCVAFFAEMARGVGHQSGLESVTPGAIVALFGFAAVGYLGGTIAEAIVRDSVQATLANEVNEIKSEQPQLLTMKS